MTHRTILRVILAVMALAVIPTPVDACSCMGGLPLCEAVWHSHVVFEATVEDVQSPKGRPVDGFLRVRLRDVKNWIGEGALEVFTPVFSSMCGYPFKVGQRYVIAAQRATTDGRLTAAVCSVTRPIEQASELLAYLATLSKPATGGRIFGALQRSLPSWGKREGRFEVIANARVLIDGAVRRTMTTDARGGYFFDSLPPGDYVVSAEMPADRPELFTRRSEKVTVRNAYACAQPFINVESRVE